MIVRSDIRTIAGLTTFFLLFLVCFNSKRGPLLAGRLVVDGHAVMTIDAFDVNAPKLALYDNLIHDSLPGLNGACSVDTARSNKSKKYPHKKDKVFLTHAHEEIGKYCFHIPSHLSFQEFIDIAKPFYEKLGLPVTFHRDYKVIATSLNNPVIGFEGQVITLDEYEEYGGLALEEFDTLIQQEKNPELKERLQELKTMRPFFDWHLKVPTVGILPEDNELPNEAKPLSWNFSAWDLAPKKGAGISVVVIDTGSASFDLPDYGFKHHPNVKDASSVIGSSLNLVSENGLSPLHQLAILVKKYCKKLKVSEIEKRLQEMVVDFLKNKKSKLFTNFLLDHCPDLTKNKVSLSDEGNDALEDILYGEEGILPGKKPGFFTLAQLGGKSVIVELLPSPISKEDMPFMATHGTFTQGIINAQPQFDGDISGIAPNVSLIPIKALEDDGATTKQNLDHAFRVTKSLNPDIVNLSLKSGEDFDESNQDDVLMKELIAQFDYVVSASGNNGDHRSASFAGSLAYPAKFETVTFDVAGFKLDNFNYTFGSFSQVERDVGPKFAAPGFNMLSSGINFETGEMCKMFMGGTSAATPIITGCVALVLGEFKDVFSREVILKVLYASTVKMNGALRWKNDVGLGMIDVRTALLCLHTLQEIENQNFNSVGKENDLILHILSLIYSSPDAMSSELEIVSIRKDLSLFAGKVTSSVGDSALEVEKMSIEKGASVKDAVQLIIDALDLENKKSVEQIPDRQFYLKLTDNEKLVDRLQTAVFRD